MMRSPALPERAIVKGKLLTGVRKLDKTDGPGASASKGGVAVLKAPRKPPPENSPRPAPKVPKKGKFGSSRRTGVEVVVKVPNPVMWKVTTPSKIPMPSLEFVSVVESNVASKVNAVGTPKAVPPRVEVGPNEPE